MYCFLKAAPLAPSLALFTTPPQNIILSLCNLGALVSGLLSAAFFTLWKNCVHSCHRYLLSTYYVPGAVVGTSNMAETKVDQVSVLRKLTFQWWG